MDTPTLNTFTFVAPSGTEYTIREQNGQDEEIISNQAEARRGMSITNYLQGIILSTSRKASKLTIKEVMGLPTLDRMCIILQSRIFSLGEELEFSHRWPKGEDTDQFDEFEYSQDLQEYLLSDYANPENITEEELQVKPKALPVYVQDPFIPIEHTLKSGKHIRFHASNGYTELAVIKLRDTEQTRNSELILRELELEVDGKWERVLNFALFSSRDMGELRKLVNTVDPTADPTTVISNPETGEKLTLSLFAIPTFFFLEEGV